MRAAGRPGLVGVVQYELQLPAEIVWVHVGLATSTWLAILWSAAAAGGSSPGRRPPPRRAEGGERLRVEARALARHRGCQDPCRRLGFCRTGSCRLTLRTRIVQTVSGAPVIGDVAAQQLEANPIAAREVVGVAMELEGERAALVARQAIGAAA